MLDGNLKWKKKIALISNKIKRSIGILSKLRYYVNLEVLIKLYYSLVYPFLTYAIVAWVNTYQTNIKPLLILQKRAIRIITFSNFDKHSSPLFKQTKILKLFDLIKIQISLFMYKFHNN